MGKICPCIFPFIHTMFIIIIKQSSRIGLVSFASPWTSPFRTDSVYSNQLVNNEGEHLLILNKTAWAYFKYINPKGVLERAKEEGVNVIRVCLEGAPYFNVLKMDCWP